MKSHVKMITLILLIGYTMLLAYWMIWGFGRTTEPEFSYNLVPFSTMTRYFPIRSLGSLINIVGNIAVFVPLEHSFRLHFKFDFVRCLLTFWPGYSCSK